MLIRELIPELTDEQFQQLVSDASKTSLLKCFKYIPGSESIMQLSTPIIYESGSAAEPAMFYALLSQMIEGERECIRRIVVGSGYVPEDQLDEFIKHLMDALARRLSNFYLRPLVAHIKDISMRGILQGSTPEARYKEYCYLWYKDFTEEFYTRYPLLQNIYKIIVKQFCTVLTEIFDRIHTHEYEIRTLLSGEDAGNLYLTSLDFSGDYHNSGRTGCILKFSQGKIVYKPRSIDGERAFYEMVEDLLKENSPKVSAARVISGAGYGFMEYVDHEAADFSEKGFLEASGRLAGLLYTLQSSDMHEENLVPKLKGPIPIDLETVLHPVRTVHERSYPGVKNDASNRKMRSISSIGVLPTRIMGRDPSRGYLDIGFIHGERGANPFAGTTIKNPFRDDAVIHFTHESEPEKDGINELPYLDQENKQYAVQINRARVFVSGFKEIYRWICKNRDFVLNLVQDKCSGLTLRVVLQSTMYYDQLIRMLGSPEALASSDVFITVAFRTAAFGTDRPFDIVAAEAESLMQLDIPFFKHNTNELEIFSANNKKINTTLRESALEEVLEHISSMNEIDLTEQIDQIWSAFVSPYPVDILAETLEEIWQHRGSTQEERELCVDIADRMVANVCPGISDKESWTWVAPTPGSKGLHSEVWDSAILDLDLYSGFLGPALGIAQAAYLLKNKEYIRTAHIVLDPVAESVLSKKASLELSDNLADGAFTGETCIAFAFAGAADYLDDPRLKEAATVLGNRVAERLIHAGHPTPDYLTGQVGAAALLLGYDLADDREALLGVLDRHAQDIIAGDVEEDWWSHSGFAHGISASIFALSRWNRQMPFPERAQHAVKILLDRLREFDSGEGWEAQISRQGSRGGVWCHGTAGISLALAAVHVWMPELSTRADLERAVHHALHEGTGRNLTYCHGDLGTLDILEWVINHVPDLPDAEKIRDILTNGYSASLLQKTLDDKSVRYSLTPSYMVGTSGVLSWLARRIGGMRLYTPIIPDSTEA